jgi:hypothetical protein
VDPMTAFEIGVTPKSPDWSHEIRMVRRDLHARHERERKEDRYLNSGVFCALRGSIRVEFRMNVSIVLALYLAALAIRTGLQTGHSMGVISITVGALSTWGELCNRRYHTSRVLRAAETEEVRTMPQYQVKAPMLAIFDDVVGKRPTVSGWSCAS